MTRHYKMSQKSHMVKLCKSHQKVIFVKIVDFQFFEFFDSSLYNLSIKTTNVIYFVVFDVLFIKIEWPL